MLLNQLPLPLRGEENVNSCNKSRLTKPPLKTPCKRVDAFSIIAMRMAMENLDGTTTINDDAATIISPPSKPKQFAPAINDLPLLMDFSKQTICYSIPEFKSALAKISTWEGESEASRADAILSLFSNASFALESEQGKAEDLTQQAILSL